MEKLDEFSSEKATKEHSKAIMTTIKDIFSVGMKEFSKSITHLFETTEGGKHQISKDLAGREKATIRKRRS